MMKASAMRDRSPEELQETYQEMRQELFKLNVRKDVADEAGNPLKARELRRSMARVKTVMREREGVMRHE